MKAKLSFARVTPRKMSSLADEVRGQDINQALTYLQFSPKKRAAGILRNLLKSAVANADQKGTIDVDTLFVKKLVVNQGPTLKRFRPRAKGAAYEIKKRTSHLTVQLEER